LEQDVRGFKTAEEQLAASLGLEDDDEERAGAMVVGRFEDGTPVVLQGADGLHHPVRNNFNFSGDAAASKCPFQGHIRKANPRGESVGAFANRVEDERSHIMALPNPPHAYASGTPISARSMTVLSSYDSCALISLSS